MQIIQIDPLVVKPPSYNSLQAQITQKIDNQDFKNTNHKYSKVSRKNTKHRKLIQNKKNKKREKKLIEAIK